MRVNRMRSRLLAIMLCILMLALGGCGASSNKSEMAAEGASGSYSSYEEAAYDAEEPAEAADIAEADAGFTENTLVQNSADTKRKLIRRVSMSCETLEYDASVASIRQLTAQCGGYMESESVDKNSYSGLHYAYFTIRIPEENLDKFLNNMDGSIKVLNQSMTTEDVTLTYSDMKAKIESLRTEQTRLNELMEKADSIETILAIEEQLASVRYQIESYESSLRELSNQVSYSTVSLDLNEVREATPLKEATFGERLAQKFVSSLEELSELIVDLVIFLIGGSPMLIFYGLVIFGIVKLIGWIRRKRSKKETVNRKSIFHRKKEQNTDEV